MKTKRTGKRRGVKGKRKGLKRRHRRNQLVNTKMAMHHHLPMADRYFTTLQSDIVFYLAANVSASQSLSSGGAPILCIPSRQQPWASPYSIGNFVSSFESSGNDYLATPAGFTQLGAIYKFYRLLAFKLDVEVIGHSFNLPGPGPESDETFYWGIYPYTANNVASPVVTVPPLQYLFDVEKVPWGKTRMQTTRNYSSQATKTTLFCRTKDLYGVDAATVLSEDNYAGYTNVSANGIPDAVGVGFCYGTDLGRISAATYVSTNYLVKCTLKGYYCFCNVNNSIGS